MSLIKSNLLALLAALLFIFSPAIHAATSCGITNLGLIDSRSVAATLATDVSVGENPVVLATTMVSLCETHSVFLHAAGNWFYLNGAPLGEMRIRVDGAFLPNLTAMVFSLPGQRHPFSLVGAVDLAAGSHTVELVALRTLGTGNFVVQASTQVAALVGFSTVLQTVLSTDVSVPQPTSIVAATMNLSPGGAVFLNHSGTVQRVANSGDALTLITVDGQSISTMGINDMVQFHEEIAPISSLAIAFPAAGSHPFGLVSQPLITPTYPNNVSFKLLHGSSLVAAFGGITGGTTVGVDTVPVPFPAGSDSVYYLAPVSFYLPADHNGNVWITTHGRWLDNANSGTGGLVAAILELDGTLVGPWAV